MGKTTPFKEQILQRKKKLEALVEKYGYPYPNDFKPEVALKSIRDKFEALSGKEIEKKKVKFRVAGRVMAIRLFGKAAFAVIKDSTSTIQLFFQKNELGDKYSEFKKLIDIGDIIGAEGILFKTKTGELTVNVEDFRILVKSLRPLPEKWHGLSDVEVRYRQRYVDLIVNDSVREIFKTRAKIIKLIRGFLDDRGFMEVETPMMHSIPGGAKARPFTTHHNALDMDLYLRIAPELYLKRLVVGGFERVYELNRNFRNEGISTQHNPEFTMIEFYQTYATFENLMDLTEELITYLLKEIKGDLKITYLDKELDFTPPWERMTLRDAIVKYAGVPENKLFDEDFLRNKLRQYEIDTTMLTTAGELQTTIFEEFVEEQLINPTFVTHFPVEVSPLARRNLKDPSVTDRFELYIYGREIANAFSELNDPHDQLERFKMQLEDRERGDEEVPPEIDYDYVRALEYGLPPTAGEGIGIDRLVMLLTNQSSIREVILFPLLRRKKEEEWG